MEAEFGAAAVGLRHVDLRLRIGRAASSAPTRSDGAWQLARLDTATRRARRRSRLPYTDIGGRARRARAARSSSAARPPSAPAVVLLDLASRPASRCCARRATSTIDPGYLSAPQPIEFPTERRPDRARASSTRRATATSPRPPGERPPLLVMSHGGPTGATSATLQPADPVLDQPRLRRARRQLRRQHRLRPRLPRAAQRPAGASSTWTTASTARATWSQRGRGRRRAAGHPRRQRRRLHDAGALTFRDVFKAGASHYGISDLEALATRHAQVRVALPRPADRPLPGAARPLRRALADPLHRPAVAAR